MFPIQHHPTSRQLAVFALAWLAFLGAWGAVAWWKTGSLLLAGACWVAAVAVPALGLITPELLRLVYVGFSYAALPIGLVVSHIILAVVYYAVLTPIGLGLRLFGHDPMHRRFEPDAKTYWVPREEDDDAERSFRQF